MPHSADSPIHWSATQIASRIAAREISCAEVVQAHIDRIQQVDGKINAVVVRRFVEALHEAEAADATLAGSPSRELPPLFGVPMTVKECFHVAGTPSCIGLTAAEHRAFVAKDGLLVQRLKCAGAIIVGKTNLPQLMIWHECDNPVYGRTNNPWDLERTPGGSTGGEAAIVAARGSPLGLGNDLGGSIRVPAHFCGIHGLKPTSYRLPRVGTTGTFHGLESIVTQAGPFARHVEDLWLALQVLTDDRDGYVASDVTPAPLRDPAAVRVDRLKIACWTDDGVFPAAASVQRAVREAADALRQQGASVIEMDPIAFSQPHSLNDMFDIYCGLIGADGAADARRLTRGSQVDWRVGRLMWLAGLDRLSRAAVIASLRMSGQSWMARLVSVAGRRSADEFWRLTNRRTLFSQIFTTSFREQGFDAVLCPPHALPAMQHAKGFDLIAAASYSYLFNLLGWPAGVVSTSRVREGEEVGRPETKDKVLRQALAVQRGSTGLPLAVQVAAPYWREDIVLSVISSLESAFCQRSDYPMTSIVPRDTVV